MTSRRTTSTNYLAFIGPSIILPYPHDSSNIPGRRSCRRLDSNREASYTLLEKRTAPSFAFLEERDDQKSGSRSPKRADDHLGSRAQGWYYCARSLWRRLLPPYWQNRRHGSQG